MSLPPVIVRWDLDQTYLRSEIDSIRGLVRVPFENASDKIDVPGVVELLRSLRLSASNQERGLQVFFVSASPPQIGNTIREKFELDGISVDGIVFKDQLQILMRGKFRGLREQSGFKLTELLRGRLAAPEGAIEYLFGDDWETDSIIYSLYADLVAGRVDGASLARILDAIRVDADWTAHILELLGQVTTGEAVRRIFINLERRTPPGLFRAFGSRLVPTFNYFQTAVCLFAEGVLDLDGVERVGRALIERESWSRSMLENALEDVVRRGHLDPPAWQMLRRGLRRRILVPPRPRSLRQFWEEWRSPGERTVPAVAGPLPEQYESLILDWKTQR